MRRCSAYAMNEIRRHALLDIHEISCLSRVSVIVFVRRVRLVGIPAAWDSSVAASAVLE